MPIARALLPLLLLALPCAAQEDPLKSPACGEAIARLQAARSGGAEPASVEALRAAAAATCLGNASPPTRPGRVQQPPVAIPPPAIEVPAYAVPALPVPLPAPPPVAIERPPSPALCDAGGCWTNDGTHLRHVPPNLYGPRGLCTQHGGLVYCP
jgi:hypothetical protein